MANASVSRAGCAGTVKLLAGLVAVLVVGGVDAATESGVDLPRVSTSRHYVEGARSGAAPTTVSQDRYEALVTQGTRGKPGSPAAENGTSGNPVMESASHDFWIYSADVLLFGDDDADGYHYGIDLLFDADTLFEMADVYAVLYLSLEGGPWNEYATTEDFTLFGATSDDEYGVVTALDSGFPTGSYDLLIELYDAVDGTFLTSLGPEDTSELALLPLEDFERDDPSFDDRHHHGGGGLGLPMLAALLLVLAGARLAGDHA